MLAELPRLEIAFAGNALKCSPAKPPDCTCCLAAATLRESRRSSPEAVTGA